MTEEKKNEIIVLMTGMVEAGEKLVELMERLEATTDNEVILDLLENDSEFGELYTRLNII